MISITQHAMAPPPLFNAGQGEKIFIIEDLGDKVAELATLLATAIGCNIDHFMALSSSLRFP